MEWDEAQRYMEDNYGDVVKLPTESRQEFQIGDICKIVEKGKNHEAIQHPKGQPLEDYLQDRECIILHTYGQVYSGNDFSSYCVYLLPRYKNEYYGFFGWIEVNQLRFVRKPSQLEIDIVVNEDTKCSAWVNHPYKSIFRLKEE